MKDVKLSICFNNNLELKHIIIFMMVKEVKLTNLFDNDIKLNPQFMSKVIKDVKFFIYLTIMSYLHTHFS